MDPKEYEVSKALVARIESGDVLAESEMVARYQRGLHLMLQKKSDLHIAEEVSQETWRVVIERLRNKELRDAEKLAAFIIQTGRNQLIMYYRKNTPNSEDGNVEQVQPVISQGPSVHHEHERRREFIRQQLAKLGTKRDREILKRYYLMEQEKAEICAALDLSDLHFNRVLHRAKQRLKAFLGDFQEFASGD